MPENNLPTASPNADRQNVKRRVARTIRFSAPEWEHIERAADDYGTSPAAFARHAAVSFTEGKLRPSDDALAPGHDPLGEATYRFAFLLMSLKREEMIREGRGEEVDDMMEQAREMQAKLQNRTPE